MAIILEMTEERELCAIVAALRLLAASMDKGLVRPNDGDIGDILTSSGSVPPLSADEVAAMCDKILEG